ncbi:MAG TPA: type II toxin-antitoxin system Phd/YefM family antitoxin [Pyrinomonadaceae bacterium]
MITTKEQYVIDANGKRTAVLLEIKQYEKLLEAQEELESIRAYDEAKTSKDAPIPFSQATAEIEEMHK